MGAGDFAENAVGAEQGQEATDAGGTATFDIGGAANREQQNPEVAVA
ncbi:MAG TPA: hypothetical protein VGA17_02420 [Nitrospiraceae bacterium]